MLAHELLHPASIAVVGASNDLSKPGGKVLHNLLHGSFSGSLHAVNPKGTVVQGIQSVPAVGKLPSVELAILAVPAVETVSAVELLAATKGTRAFIVLSAGFGEVGETGRALEQQLVRTVEKHGCTLIGPNSIGLITPDYQGAFTSPVPKLDANGCDLISGSGATAVFILEAGIPKGLRFHSVYSVGNSAQVGVEEILAHMDESFDTTRDAKIKLLYIENIRRPDLVLKHGSSLIRKGCRIAAIKAGRSEAGGKAAAFHTGALATSDMAVEALFRKAGIIRCYGREDLVAVASILTHKPLTGHRIAVITHAGGPGVMMTDALEEGGFDLPEFKDSSSDLLLAELFPGSSVRNPIDFLATGTAEQLGKVIDFASNSDQVDGMAVIFGTPGLRPVFDAYMVIHEKIENCAKPIFPVLPSVIAASEEVAEFVSRRHSFFPDEVMFAKALARVYAETPCSGTTSTPQPQITKAFPLSEKVILNPDLVANLLDIAGIQRPMELFCKSTNQIPPELNFPVAVKVAGPIHKTETGGVVLNLRDMADVKIAAAKMLSMDHATGFVIQEMVEGVELYVGVKYEEEYGHLILCGLGGTLVELFTEKSVSLVPLTEREAEWMVSHLHMDRFFDGFRGRAGVDRSAFAGILLRLSALVQTYPEIREVDLNPIIGSGKNLKVVDARIRT